MIQLRSIEVSDSGKRINYSFTHSGKFGKFVNDNSPLYIKFNKDVSEVPPSILAIPFVSNWLPIVWFSGFELIVDQLDKSFYRAMLEVRNEFQKQFPKYKLHGQIKVKNLIENRIVGQKSALLFSGGVDAFASFIRHANKKPDLITIHGADIAINDIEQWNNFKDYLSEENILESYSKEYVETNVRDFYTYEVQLLLKNIGWWGKVQHGLSLIGSIAPLSYVNGYKNLYIASSYTKEVNVAWGSTPDIDNKIKWADLVVHHDGFELKRQDKVDLISQFYDSKKKPFKLRVCYSELRTSFNCSRCEKCCRTILGIILNNQNPNNFGFNVDGRIYDQILDNIGKGPGSAGLTYFWWELMEKAKQTDDFYVFDDYRIENEKLDRIRNGEIDRWLTKNLINKSRSKRQRLRFIISNKLPWVRNLYRKIKY